MENEENLYETYLDTLQETHSDEKDQNDNIML